MGDETKKKKGFLKRLTTSPAEEDREKLLDFCSGIDGASRIGELAARVDSTVVGEIRNVRIVPRAEGARWLEATVDDGTGAITVMWTGRTRIAGVKPGQRLKVAGRFAPTGPGGRLMITNPHYELL